MSHSPTDRAEGAGDAVVIVGGGVIGLSTAYQLARGSGSKLKIIVLEIRSSPSAAASSHNTGCIHYYFPESFVQDLTPLGKYSFDLWKSISRSDPQFVEDTGYRSDPFFPIIPGSGHGEESLPNWIEREEHWDIGWGIRGDPCAVVNPQGIARWLKRECKAMGVEIWTSTTVTAAFISESDAVEGIECLSTETGETYSLSCQKLVLTAGPWTPSLVKALFPKSALDLQPSNNAGDWVIVKNKIQLQKESQAVVFFDRIVNEKLEFAGWNDGTIWACGRRNLTATPPPPNKEDEPDENVISDLVNNFRKFTHADTDSSLDLQLLAKGRSFRPSTVSGLPFISKIPYNLLLSSDGAHSTTSAGVYICYGHGSYGVTLGIGSGKLMAQLIRNEKTDIDISKFTVGCG